MLKNNRNLRSQQALIAAARPHQHGCNLPGIERSAFGESSARSISLNSARARCIATRAEQNSSFANTALCKKGKRSHHIAIDLTLIPYHGEEYEDEKEIRRGEAKSGTTHFHGYATVSIAHDNQRYVLALRFVEKGESMEIIVKWLLKA